MSGFVDELTGDVRKAKEFLYSAVGALVSEEAWREPDLFVSEHVVDEQNDTDEESLFSISNPETPSHVSLRGSAANTWRTAQEDSDVRLADDDQLHESRPEMGGVDDNSFNDDEKRSACTNLRPSVVQPDSFSERPPDDSDDTDEGVSLTDRRNTATF